jgi:HEAT repeat protein
MAFVQSYLEIISWITGGKMKKRTLKNKIIQAGVLLGLSFIILPGTVSCDDNGEKGKLLQELKSRDAFGRELAVVRLGELKVISAVEPLIDTLKDKEPLVRQAAVRSLGQIGEPRAIPAISNLLQDHDETVQIAAWQTLERFGWKPNSPEEKARVHIINQEWEKVLLLGNAAHQPLLKMLSHHSAAARKEAAWCLGKINDPGFLEPLSQLLSDKNWPVRYEAVLALTKIDGDSAAKKLIKALDDSCVEVRLGVVRAAVKLRDNSGLILLQKAGTDCDSEIRFLASAGLEKLGWSPPTISDKVYQLINKKKWDDVVKIGKPAVKPLIEQLNDKDPEIRLGAVSALGKVGDPEAISPVAKLFHDKESKVRDAAVEALGNIRSPRAYDILLETMMQGDEFMADDAAAALAQFKNREALNALLKAANHEKDIIREGAAEGLGIIGDPGSARVLLQLLKDKVEDVRKTAQWALQRIQDPRVTALLIETLKDNNPGVRKLAAEALREHRSAACIKPLITLLEDPDSHVSEQAIYTLRPYRSSLATIPLVKIIKGTNIPLACQVTFSLAEINDPRAAEGLCWALGHGDYWLRKSADTALSKVKPPLAAPFLVPLLESQIEGSYITAAQVLDYIDNHKLTNQLTKRYISVLKNPRESLENRIRAANILGRLLDHRSLIPLVRCLAESPRKLKDNAANALDKFHLRLIGGKYIEPMDENKRRRCFKVLRDLKGQPEVDILIDALRNLTTNNDQNIRSSVMKILGEINDPKAIDPLIHACYDHISTNRELAVLTLGKFKHSKARQVLIRVLKDKYCGMRKEAAAALGETGGSDATAALLEVYHDKNILNLELVQERPKLLKNDYGIVYLEYIIKDNEKLKPTILESLGKLRYPGLFPLLEEIFSGKLEDEYFLYSAAIALGFLKDQRGVTPLMELLKKGKYSTISWLQTAIFQALKNITGKDFGEDEKKWLLWYQESRNKEDKK